MTQFIADKTLAARVKNGREHLGLSIEQLAALIGITTEQQMAIEDAQFEGGLEFNYYDALKKSGFDLAYIFGDTDTPKYTSGALAFHDDDFNQAVALLRRSTQAVEAFVGKGAAASCPQLVAATMNATIQHRYALGAGFIEEMAEKLNFALEGAATIIADALNKNNKPEDF